LEAARIHVHEAWNQFVVTRVSLDKNDPIGIAVPAANMLAMNLAFYLHETAVEDNIKALLMTFIAHYTVHWNLLRIPTLFYPDDPAPKRTRINRHFYFGKSAVSTSLTLIQTPS
jgi:hypothetical protein